MNPVVPFLPVSPPLLRRAGSCLTAVLLAGLALPAGAQTVSGTRGPAGPSANPNGTPGRVFRVTPPVVAAQMPVVAPQRRAAVGPVVTALSPTRNQRNALRTSNVAVTFSETLNPTAATQGALKVFSAQRGGKVAGAAAVSGSTLSFDPTTDFRAGETVSATITTAAQGASGNTLAQPQVFQFTAAVGGGGANLSTPAVTAQVATPSSPFNLAIGDLDGDGDLDMAVPNVSSNVVSIRLNSGLNTTNFIPSGINPEVSVGGTPRTVVLGDVDGDGDLDLVSTQNFSGSTVSVRLNNGSGSFFAPAINPEVSVGGSPLSAVLGDVDGDGDLDLLVANNADNTVSIRLNSGLNSGNFVAPATNAQVSVGTYPLGMALGDVDGDGDLDVVTTSYTGTTVSLRLNNGSGAFFAPATSPEVTVGNAPVLVTMGDVDGDGDLDLLTDNYNDNTASIRLNSGLNSGNFVAPATNAQVSVGTNPESIVLGDLDADGDLDLLTTNLGSNTVSVRLNNGSGAYSVPTANPDIAVGAQPAGLALGDLDNDGDLDFIASNFGSSNVSIRLNQGSPDLVVSTVQNVSGTYNNITVTSTGVATLTGALSAATTLTVKTGGALYTDCQPLTGSGSFTLEAGATLGICDPAGITSTGATGAVQLSGTRSFSPGASYIYNGTAAQVTGSGLPAQVRTLSTTNANAVTLSAPTSVAQVLTVGGAGNLALNGQELTLLSGSAGTALLVNSGSGLVTGNTGVMQRYLDGSGNAAGIGYRHYSAPVAGSSVADLGTTGFTPSVNDGYNNSATPLTFTPFPTVFGYNQSRLANAYTGISQFDKGFESPVSTADPLVVGKGYTVNIPNSALVDFKGTFNQGAKTISGLSYLANAADAPVDQAGWHLVGNPYPAPLDWGTVTDAARPNVGAAVYVYQSTSQYGGVYKSFVNGTGAGTGLIAAGQGFFVRATSTINPGSIALTNANRQTTFSGQPAFQRPAALRPQVQLSLSNSAATLSDDVYVYAEAGATPAFDSRFDAYKLTNTTGLNVAALTSSNEALSVQGLASFSTTEVVVPLQVSVPAAGTYSLRAAQVANLPAGTYAYLRDAQTGALIDLARQPAYDFALSTTSTGPRFSLVLTPNQILAVAPAALSRQVAVYPNPAHSAISIELPAALRQQASTVSVLNALSQRVRQFTLPATASAQARVLPLDGLAPGLYLVSLSTAQGLVVKRLVVE